MRVWAAVGTDRACRTCTPPPAQVAIGDPCLLEVTRSPKHQLRAAAASPRPWSAQLPRLPEARALEGLEQKVVHRKHVNIISEVLNVEEVRATWIKPGNKPSLSSALLRRALRSAWGRRGRGSKAFAPQALMYKMQA